jgi:hypothetical protein
MNSTAELTGHGSALQLSCTQLRLEVEQRPLDLYLHDVACRLQHHVGCPPIGRRSNRDLESHTDSSVHRSADEFCDAELPRVPQSHALGRKEVDG